MRKQEWSWKIIVVEVIYTFKRLLMGDELNRKQSFPLNDHKRKMYVSGFMS